MLNLHGIFLSIFVAIIATFISFLIPIGSITLAIIIGALIGNLIKIQPKYNNGITFSEHKFLAISIALMGVNLDFGILSELGFKVIALIVISIIFTIYISLVFAKIFNFNKKFSLILGIGNGICGSAAIAATKDIVGLNKQKAALGVAIINFLGTIGIFLIPFIGSYFLHLNDVNLGIIIGNTLQAVGQTLAAGFSVNDEVGQSATIVKMGRILMLTPLILFLIYFITKQNKKQQIQEKKLQIPLFIVGFILFSIASTLKLFPNELIDYLSSLSHYLLLVAMAAIGLKMNFKILKKHGIIALKIATLIFTIQIMFTSLALYIFFNN